MRLPAPRPMHAWPTVPDLLSATPGARILDPYVVGIMAFAGIPERDVQAQYEAWKANRP